MKSQALVSTLRSGLVKLGSLLASVFSLDDDMVTTMLGWQKVKLVSSSL